MSDEDDQYGFDFDGPTHDVPHARTHDPFTSKRSGEQTEREEGTTSLIKPYTTKHLALRTLSRRPATGIEVERDAQRRGIWKRVADLKKPGLIEEIGTRRDPVTGREGLVCGITPKGRRVLELLDQGQQVRL